MRMAQTNLNSRKILWKSSFDQQTMKSLDVPAVNKLEPQSNSMDNRFSSIDSKLDFLLKAVEKRRVHDSVHTLTRVPESSSSQSQVWLQNLEQNRTDSQLGYRAGVLNVESSDHIIKNAERPVLDVAYV